MWVASKYGWFSIVDKGDGIHVRARRRQDLVDLAAAVWDVWKTVHPQEIPTVQTSYPGSDYPWRMIVNAPQLRLIMGTLAASVDYPNFKAMIHDTPHQAHKGAGYGKMWAIAKQWEE